MFEQSIEIFLKMLFHVTDDVSETEKGNNNGKFFQIKRPAMCCTERALFSRTNTKMSGWMVLLVLLAEAYSDSLQKKVGINDIRLITSSPNNRYHLPIPRSY